jgi:coenzyme F420-0:L-glutamate ligase/coenzyme F420-1:gamma-L-glutamate ligase
MIRHPPQRNQSLLRAMRQENSRSILIFPLRLPLIKTGQKLNAIVHQSLKKHNLRLKKGDVIAVASKIVSTCEGRQVKLDQVLVTGAAKRASQRYKLDERLAALVLQEADEILGGVPGFMLVKKSGILTANAGIDMKNSPQGSATLWPINPDRSAMRLRRSLEKQSGKRLGVIVVDSRVTALRLGTVGLAIGLSGIAPVIDHRGTPDIYGRNARVTQTNVADDLASSAHLLMGETGEHIGVVLVRGAPIALNSQANSRAARLTADRCLMTNSTVPHH